MSARGKRAVSDAFPAWHQAGWCLACLRALKGNSVIHVANLDYASYLVVMEEFRCRWAVFNFLYEWGLGSKLGPQMHNRRIDYSPPITTVLHPWLLALELVCTLIGAHRHEEFPSSNRRPQRRQHLVNHFPLTTWVASK